MKKTVTRTYYFDGELLGTADFVRDQQYVRDVFIAQNAALLSAGVVDGLAGSVSNRTVMIGPGLAIDARGFPIIVPSPISLDVAADPAGGLFNLTIAYSDSIQSKTPKDKLRANHTIVEQPLLALSPAAAQAAVTTAIVLGTVKVDGATVTFTNDGRQFARLKLAPPTAAAQPPAPQPGPAQPQLSPDAPVTIKGPLTVGDPLTGTAVPVSAPLVAQIDFTQRKDSHAAASFGFSSGASASGTLAIGKAGAAGEFVFLELSHNGTAVWSIDQDGTVHTASDARLKRDIADIDNALLSVSRLRPVSFRAQGGALRIGVLAQDLEHVLPQSVRTEASGVKSVAYGDLIGVLVKAVQEMARRIDALEQQLSERDAAPDKDPIP